MELVFLGTGCPSVSLERYGPAHLIRSGGQEVLIDCGSGVTQRLLQAGTHGAAIDLVVLTHLHSDHIVDLYQLIVSGWHQGRPNPLKVAGPDGTRAYVEGLLDLWGPERAQRLAHERRPNPKGLEVEVEEFGEAWFCDLDGMEIAAFQVEHQPVKQAFGFSFGAEGRKIVVSGDTRRCAAVIEAARGADLLLHEVFVHREMPPLEGRRSAETVAAVASYHTLSSEVGKIAAEAGVGALALTHFVPPQADRAALLAEVRADFKGPVVLGEDLMTIDLAARRLTYGQAHISLDIEARA